MQICNFFSFMANGKGNWARLSEVIERSGMTTNFFAHYIGLPCGENLYQIKRGNNGISRDVAERIVSKFPEISKAWLLTGEGSMFANESTSAQQIPYYNIDVEVTLGDRLPDEPDFKMFVPQVGECDFAMVYNGRAMGRITPSGTVVFLRKIDVEAIIPGDEYVVVSAKFTALRTIRKPKGSSSLTLVAGDRRSFDDMPLEVGDIKSLYHVVGKLMVKN